MHPHYVWAWGDGRAQGQCPHWTLELVSFHFSKCLFNPDISFELGRTRCSSQHQRSRPGHWQRSLRKEPCLGRGFPFWLFSAILNKPSLKGLGDFWRSWLTERWRETMSSDSAVGSPQHCIALQQSIEQATALGCKWNIFLLQFTLFSVLSFHSTRECKFITSQFRITLILPWGFCINLGYINHTFQLLPIYSVVVCVSSRRHWFMFHRLIALFCTIRPHILVIEKVVC